ncbi:hypothetical protein ACIBJC_22685 [Streptomyces sp. NPDC050509]|uniref:hypothetical protein n=1 Tax=Streptomyces sp. NPDC050509 TaxID=3365620 RepID=UPI00378ED663
MNDATHEYCDSGGFPVQVTAAPGHRSAMDRLKELVDDHEARHGELSDDDPLTELDPVFSQVR